MEDNHKNEKLKPLIDHSNVAIIKPKKRRTEKQDENFNNFVYEENNEKSKDKKIKEGKIFKFKIFNLFLKIIFYS
jgi:hypothetical protein